MFIDRILNNKKLRKGRVCYKKKDKECILVRKSMHLSTSKGNMQEWTIKEGFGGIKIRKTTRT